LAFTTKWLGLDFGRFFSQTHLVTLLLTSAMHICSLAGLKLSQVIWPLILINRSGTFWQLLEAFGSYWQLLAAFGRHWQGIETYSLK
jgi:hypothetical protein